MKKLLHLVILSLLTVIISCSSADDDKLRFLKKGNIALSESNTKDALRYYDEALKIDSAFTDAMYNKGVVFNGMAKYDEAIEELNKALNIKPNYPEALMVRGNAHLMVKQYYAAISDAEDLQKAWPDSVQGYFISGLAHTELEEFERALESFNRASKLSPDNEEVTVNLGNTYYQMQEFDRATELLERKFQDTHDQANAYNTLALIAIEEKLPARANFFIDSALNMLPTDPYFLNNKGQALLDLGLQGEAEEFFDRSLKADPYNPWVYFNKGSLHITQGKVDSGIRLLERAADLKSTEKIQKRLVEVYIEYAENTKLCAFLSTIDREWAEKLTNEYKCDQTVI